MNRITIIGNLTDDVELNSVGKDKISCGRFTVAVNRRFKDKDGNNITDFFNVITWRGIAENASKFLKKGSKCAVLGEMVSRSYEKEGVKRTIWEIVAEEVEFLSSAENKAKKTSEPRVKVEPAQMTMIDDEDLPF